VGETRNVTIGVTCESKHDRCSHEVERRVIAASGHDQVTVLRLCHPPGSAYAPKPIAVVWRVWRPSLRLRSRSMRRVVGVILVLALGGCRERPADSTSPPQPAPLVSEKLVPPNDDCYLPLSAYCKGDKCSDYARSAATIRRLGAESGCWFAFTARCGKYRLTHYGNGFVSSAEYFDESGKVIGAHNCSDVFVSGSPCPNWRHFGADIECEMRDVKDYCRSTRTAVRGRPLRQRKR
jgi:hypothetical protein